MTTYEEWRVTGLRREGDTMPFSFTWTGRGGGDSEWSAREFIRLREGDGEWADGPHLSKRTVTTSEWESVGHE